MSAVPQPALSVPATLHASLMARLDRLGPAAAGFSPLSILCRVGPKMRRHSEVLPLDRGDRNCSPWGNDAPLGMGSSGGQVILGQPH